MNRISEENSDVICFLWWKDEKSNPIYQPGIFYVFSLFKTSVMLFHCTGIAYARVQKGSKPLLGNIFCGINGSGGEAGDHFGGDHHVGGDDDDGKDWVDSKIPASS